MRITFALALGCLRNNVKRFLLTLLGVVLSVALISLVCALSSSVLYSVADAGLSSEEHGAVVTLFAVLTFLSCVMGCLMIYSAFCISFDGRIGMMGLLTSVGMSTGQKCVMVLTEAVLYAVCAVPAGVLFGTLCARTFYVRAVGMLSGIAGGETGEFHISAPWLFLSAALGVLAVLAASFSPMMRLGRISVTDSMHGLTKINISLTPGFLATLTEKLFGRMGKLAGQNYDNHKSKYRAISLSLSGGTTFFILLYSFFMYPIRDSRERGYEIAPELWSVFLLFMCFAAILVIVFLVCASGSASVNIDRRLREFAMLKSIGMQNTQLCGMMCVESVFLVYYCALYGFIGSFIADWAVYSFYVVVSDPMLRFYYPAGVFLAFVAFDAVVGLIFAAYSAFRVRKIGIIDAIRTR